jgi:alkyl hydroperoxide reductase subunit AhpC
MSVRVGDAAPDAQLDAWQRGAEGPRKLSLADHRGKWVVLFFYPRDFTLICPSEFAALGALQAEFEREDAVIIAASTDSYHSHRAWFEGDPRLAGVSFPVIADTGRRFSADYGVLLADGATLRGTFLIDPDGVVRHMSVHELDVGRNIAELLRVLRALRTGELCPADWQPGQPTLTAADEQLARAFPRLDGQRLADVSGRAGEADIVRRRDDGGEGRVATLGPGEHFGEIGLLLEARRTASVRARTDLELLALDRDAFRELVVSEEEAGADVASIARARIAGDAAS